MRVHLVALSLVLPFSTFAQTSSAPSKSEVVQYHATIDTVKYVYGVAPPVARLRPGNILEANSLDCFGNAIKKPGDTLSLSKGDNPLTGPFFIEGAEPGDTLVVHILDLQVDGNQGVGASITRRCSILRCRKESGSIPSITRAIPPPFKPSIPTTR